MIKKLLETITGAPIRATRANDRYQPERPLGFVRRTDPSFYFLSKR